MKTHRCSINQETCQMERQVTGGSLGPIVSQMI